MAAAKAKDATGSVASSKYMIIFVPIHPSCVEVSSQAEDGNRGTGLGFRKRFTGGRRNKEDHQAIKAGSSNDWSLGGQSIKPGTSNDWSIDDDASVSVMGDAVMTSDGSVAVGGKVTTISQCHSRVTTGRHSRSVTVV